jgi:RNA-directed DNA polymerase
MPILFSLWRASARRENSAASSLPETTRLRFALGAQRLTRRCVGRSVEEVVDRLRVYLLGWKGYYQLAQTPRVWLGLDEWLRHRLRAIQLKQWKRGKTMYRELLALGAKPAVARRVAANSRCWWRNSAKLLNSVLTLAYFDRLGLPRLS